MAGRPSQIGRTVRVDHVRGIALVERGDFPKVHGQLRAACHDRSPFLTVWCRCGSPWHVHETQFEGMPAVAEVVAKCPGCHEGIALGGGFLLRAFAEVKQRMEPTT